MAAAQHYITSSRAKAKKCKTRLEERFFIGHKGRGSSLYAVGSFEKIARDEHMGLSKLISRKPEKINGVTIHCIS